MMPFTTLAVIALTAASSVNGDETIAIFDGSKSSLTWQTVNDPVMGGRSVSNFTVDAAEKVGVWQGQVRIVPFLHAAGFCTLRGTGSIPDVSSFKGLEITMQAGPGTNLTNYQLQFASSNKGGNPRGGEFQADFTLTGDALQKKFIPFSSFIESWRGEKIGGAPTTAQLQTLTQIGVGSDGKAGDFNIKLSSIAAVSGTTPPGPAPAPPAPPAGPEVELVGFSADSKHKFDWDVVNDPVMGGRSRSTFVSNEARGVGIFNGTVAIVPQLKAPGFCNAEARSSLFSKTKYPDVSSMLENGGLLYRMTSTGALNSFKAAFGTSAEYDFGSYKADFNVTRGGQQEVFIPFAHFSNKWSPATGEPTTRCSSTHPEVCPTARALAEIGTVGIWAEGMAGDFHVEIQSISVTQRA